LPGDERGQDDVVGGSDDVEHTADGRYIVVRGRRWRATDPGIPEALAAELVAELMAARRAVRVDPAPARERVHDAKTALGERGEPWWEQPCEDGTRARLAATMRALLRHRAPDSTICPSDAARVVGGADWRGLMELAPEVAAALHRGGVVRVRQHGADVPPSQVSGPIRLARGPSFTG
jgi:hypothetical protein